MTTLEKIDEAIQPYMENRGDLEVADAITHMLADLRHLCDVHELSFGAVDRRAYQCYLAGRSDMARGITNQSEDDPSYSGQPTGRL